jgi:steroid delta-isomerase-like uncharacterized protein
MTDIARRYLDAWSSHDPAAIGAVMTDDVDFEEVTLGEQLHGRHEVEAFAKRFNDTFSSDYRFVLVTEATTDTSLAIEWVVSGTHDRDSPMLAATGKPFTIRGATIARLDGGRIEYNRDYWDMAGFLRDVGVLPSADVTSS